MKSNVSNQQNYLTLFLVDVCLNVTFCLKVGCNLLSTLRFFCLKFEII